MGGALIFVRYLYSAGALPFYATDVGLDFGIVGVWPMVEIWFDIFFRGFESDCCIGKRVTIARYHKENFCAKRWRPHASIFDIYVT